MLLQTREKHECKNPSKPSWAEGPLARPCCGKKEQQSFMLWVPGKILRAQMCESTARNLYISVFAAWCVFRLGVRKDWGCFGWLLINWLIIRLTDGLVDDWVEASFMCFLGVEWIQAWEPGVPLALPFPDCVLWLGKKLFASVSLPVRWSICNSLGCYGH